MPANLDIATQVIAAHHALNGMEVYEADRLQHLAEQTNHHFFEWGTETYGSWSVDDAASWVAELAPIRNEAGEVIDYTVVFIERVN
jgi:hypothetical protein